MEFQADAALGLLSDASKQFAAMLPAVNVQPAQVPVTQSAQAYVAAIQGLQQQLVAFAAPPPGSTKAALEQQVAALQQELSRADDLLQEASALVQHWQLNCQDMRSKHEAVLTQGIGIQAMPLTPPAADDMAVDGAAEAAQTQ